MYRNKYVPKQVVIAKIWRNDTGYKKDWYFFYKNNKFRLQTCSGLGAAPQDEKEWQEDEEDD